jgi:hypothetical protein
LGRFEGGFLFYCVALINLHAHTFLCRVIADCFPLQPREES